ncbi:MAG: response regulator [Deltaproteobacteria bacterium]|nr:response regulator [Deltaproteobacteria bacterium]
MDKKELEFRERLLATFMVEAGDHLQALEAGLIALEREVPPEEARSVVETVFRAAHSLKGAARAVNMLEIERICQCLEDYFQSWKHHGVTRLPELFNAIYDVIEGMRSFLASYDVNAPEGSKTYVSRLLGGLSRFEAMGRREPAPESKKPEAPEAPKAMETPPPQTAEPAGAGSKPALKEKAAAPETVRIASSKLTKMLLETEELLTARLAYAQHTAQLADTAGMIELMKGEFSKIYLNVMPSIEKDEGRALAPADTARLGELLSETQTRVRALDGRFKTLAKAARLNQKAFDRMTGALLDDVKDAMMLPFRTLLEGFPILVRNLSHEQGKLVDVELRGEGLEIDRRILEEIKAPLTHLVRNAVDHGIESPAERTRLKKPERGRILISIAHAEGSKADIVISDDGTGIDLTSVRDAIVKSGIMSREDARRLGDEAALSFIFQSGVSTSPIITDISGRGLGLAIVREKVEKLGGSVSAETSEKNGTVFRMRLPLTLATFRGILVKAGGAVFIVPTATVIKTLRVRNEEIMTAENRETIAFEGRPLSFVRLEHVLELPVKTKKKAAGEARFTQAVILGSAGGRIAFGVEEVLGEQEVLVKPLGAQLVRVRNVAGAAILGTGKPVPVLSVSDLLVEAVKAASSGHAAAPAEEKTDRQRILVVEDSITSRILLKNILEGAGYDVKTAVDGVDALTALKTEPFDLVVSDIEMPRMHGIDLTARIRADKKLSELPVILVTALDSREDRERGVSVGANAYIVKSSFNQGNLLEVVKRLI